MDELGDMDSAGKAASPHGSVVAENENILTAKYQYSPLKTPASIRLLVIEKDGNHGHVRFSLEEADLNDSPQYEALSYTWKSEDGSSETVGLKIGDIGIVRITENLHDFLQHLIDMMLEEPVRRTLWADQVCINQEDTEERNQQVALMGDIFRSASSTLIWLGLPDELSAPFLDLLPVVTAPPFEFEASLQVQEITGKLRKFFESDG
jgi:hypothetical protein